MVSLSNDKQAEIIIEGFDFTSIYIDDLLNIGLNFYLSYILQS